ncbi:hypothetical protein KW428_18570 [Vibrio fluvialis]|nr:hypothetical protein [Vibrio fluvialis]
MIKFNNNVKEAYYYQVISFTITMLTPILIVNVYDAILWGKVVLLTSTVGILINIVSVRSGEAVVYFSLKEKYYSIKQAFTYGFVFDVMVFFLYLILTIIIINASANLIFIRNFFDGIKTENIIMFFASGGVTIFFGSGKGGLLIDDSQRLINVSSVIQPIIKIVAIVFLYYCTFLDGLDVVAISYLMSDLSLLIFYILCNRKKLSLFSYLIPTKEYFEYSTKLFLSSLLKAGNQKIDVMIVKYYLGYEITAFLDLIKKLFSPLNIINMVLTNQKTKEIMVLLTKDRIIECNVKIQRINKYQWIFILLYVLLLLILFECNMLRWVGIPNGVSINSALFLVFCLSYSSSFLLWWTRIFSSAINPMISVKANFYALIYISLIVNLITNIWLINGFVVSYASYTLFIYLFWTYVRKKYD